MLQCSFESLSADGNANKRVPSAYASSFSLLPQTPLERPSATWPSKSSALTPRWDLLCPDEPISIKIVSQRYLAPGQSIWNHRIGWISVTNTAGQIVYDPFVTYAKEPGLKKHFTNRRYNVAREDLLFRNGARNGKEVERNLMRLFNGRTVVVHGGKGYSDSCYYYDDVLGDSLVWDTQALYAGLQDDSQPTLSTVARLVLGRSIRHDGEDERRPDQDATTAMELYLLKFPYDREAKRVQCDLSGWTPEAQLQLSTGKRKEIKKAKSTLVLSIRHGSSSSMIARRPGSDEGVRPQSAPLDKTLDAAAQFALRLQRRHFADLAVQGGRESRQECF